MSMYDREELIYGSARRSTDIQAHSGELVRVRILKHSTGIVDGRSLATLKPGLIYELPQSLAEYLVANRCAEHVLSERAASRVPPEDERAMADHLGKGVRVEQAVAADRPPRKRRKSR